MRHNGYMNTDQYTGMTKWAKVDKEHDKAKTIKKKKIYLEIPDRQLRRSYPFVVSHQNNLKC